MTYMIIGLCVGLVAGIVIGIKIGIWLSEPEPEKSGYQKLLDALKEADRSKSANV
jgi:Mg/Co/Ni transporter MgtE